jgi:DNA-binding NarL/FixJ family response regulator
LSATTSTVRVLIADDQTLFRVGLARLLEEDPRVQIVGQAGDGAEAVKLAGSLKPDVVLMDLKMPNLDGIEATRQIAASYPGVKVLLLTTSSRPSRRAPAATSSRTRSRTRSSPACWP